MPCERFVDHRASPHRNTGHSLGFSRTLSRSEFFYEPTRGTRATGQHATPSSDASTWTRLNTHFSCLCFICCVILASVAVLFVFPALRSAGPDHHLHFSQSTFLGGSKSCIYTRSAASRQRNGCIKYWPFLSFSFHVVSQGAPNSTVARPRELVRIPSVLSTLAPCAGWLVGRRRQNLIRSGCILVCGVDYLIASGYRTWSW